jgi:alpha-glucosidase
VKRRDFLAAGATLAAAAGIGRTARAQPALPVGDFLLSRSDSVLTVAHRAAPDRVLWETDPQGNFLAAERATQRNWIRGTPEGSFDIVDAVAARWDRPTIEAIEPGVNGATVTGRLGGPGRVRYRLGFEAAASDQLRFAVSVDDPAVNRIALRLGSRADEGFYGFGQQLTYFDQKGFLLPILVQEHGIGRGRAVVTRLVDVLASRGGGSPFVTECPAPHFITSRLRSLFLENLEYSTFDLRQAEQVDIKVWSGAMSGRILYGATPLDLIETYTGYAGRMRALPDWVHQGVIAGVQGGTEAVRGKLATLRQAGVPLAGLWIQDWCGARTTEVGTQLWWDWRLDETYYPGWGELVADVEAGGGKVLVYINPFLARAPGHDALYEHALAAGYLVRHPDGAPFLIRNTTFEAGLLDLSNPEARAWIKKIIRDELIGRAGAAGWMNDFGEALPFRAKLADGDPALWHNRYPEEWARVSREVVDATGRDDMVFFDRSGFTRSPGIATLFWLGDQMQSWDEYDGIKTAVVGLLSGGVSGFSLLHSDTGGYVVLKLGLDGRQIPLIARTPELLMRWMELNAFTAVFRTHEGLDPTVAAQFDTDAATLAQLLRFAKIYRGLGAYRKGLVAEAAARGHPVVRHPFLHYPDDPNVGALRYQFLLGPDLMVAPVLDRGALAVDVYFPEGSAWTDLWTGGDAGSPGEWATMPAPLGQPAVFLRKDAPAAGPILEGLRAEGVL